jgi:hypothetical protein
MTAGAYFFQSPSTFLKGIKKNTQAVVRPLKNKFRRKIHLLEERQRRITDSIMLTTHQESLLCEANAPPTTGPMPCATATTEPSFMVSRPLH